VGYLRESARSALFPTMNEAGRKGRLEEEKEKETREKRESLWERKNM